MGDADSVPRRIGQNPSRNGGERKKLVVPDCGDADPMSDRGLRDDPMLHFDGNDAPGGATTAPAPGDDGQEGRRNHA